MKTTWKTLAAPLMFGGLYLGCEEAESAPFYQERTVETRDIVVAASAAGVIEPVLTVDIKSKASGEIIDLRVETGDGVTRGQLVALIDRRNPENTLAQADADLVVARAQLENAEAQLRRSEALFESQSITEQELDDARLQRANANASKVRAEVTLQNAEDALEDTRVVAPINGTIILKEVERGQVIASATNVSGGTILMQMADLDTVQVRALVDETDIGKIAPDLAATITVDAFPNQPFQGRVLKIEPQAEVQQNVTMFPVLVRIDNRQGLLKPGMSAEVEVHISQATGVLAVPSAALRTPADVASAAMVLGLNPEEVQEQIAQAREAQRTEASARFGGATQQDAEGEPPEGQRTVSFGGREVTLPEGVTEEQVRAIIEKMRSGGGPQSLSAADRRILTQLRGGNGQGGRRGADRRQQSATAFQFGGEYVVFTLQDGIPTPTVIRTGLTDLDWAEVRSGLEEGQTVLVLPSLGLLQEQEDFANRFRSMGQLPGMGGNNSSSTRRR